MKISIISFGALISFATVCGLAQQKPASSPARTPTPKLPATKQSGANAKKGGAGAEAQKDSNDVFGDNGKDRPTGPTEITATQEAQFDTKTRTGVFIGNVKVVDPQFILTSDRLTVHLNRDEDGGGLNEAEAQGNVVIVHVNQPKPQGSSPAPAASPAAGRTAVGNPPAPARSQQPTTSTGRGDKAVYEAKDGSVTLTGWPQINQGGNTHIATAPDVKMVLYRDGRMQTYGSTRTLIEDRTATNNPNANGPH